MVYILTLGINLCFLLKISHPLSHIHIYTRYQAENKKWDSIVGSFRHKIIKTFGNFSINLRLLCDWQEKFMLSKIGFLNYHYAYIKVSQMGALPSKLWQTTTHNHKDGIEHLSVWASLHTPRLIPTGPEITKPQTKSCTLMFDIGLITL